MNHRSYESEIDNLRGLPHPDKNYPLMAIAIMDLFKKHGEFLYHYYAWHDGFSLSVHKPARSWPSLIVDLITTDGEYTFFTGGMRDVANIENEIIRFSKSP